MARAGDVIESPVIGERAVFRKTAADTDGALLQLEVFQRAGAKGPVEHYHTQQEERFEVVSGVMCALVGGREMRLAPGETIVIPAGTPHRWWNGGYEELHVVAELRPALQAERFFETIFGLARDGKTGADGSPAFLQIALFASAYDIWVPKPPRLVQRALFAVLGPIARLRGYRAWYPDYSEPGDSPAQLAATPASRAVQE
jgi:mannose-6-phosphate isomerase-like protein (cupin superfamily)